DVVLDRERDLIVQPAVLFVAADRLSIIRGQVWGAPDLVAEVLSPRTRAHDGGDKLQWYRQYGMRECWLVDAVPERVTIVDFTGAQPVERSARGLEPLHSSVLPALHASAFALFSGPTRRALTRADAIPSNGFWSRTRTRTRTKNQEPRTKNPEPRTPNPDYETSPPRSQIRPARPRPFAAVHDGGAAFDRARHRRQHRDLYAGRRSAAAQAAGKGAAAAGPLHRPAEPLRQQLGREHAVVPDVRRFP